MSKALVIAHYHQEGSLRSDTAEFINKATNYFDEIVFVSTNLNKSEALNFPKKVSVIVRENKGYDFYSYKIGIHALQEKDWGSISELTIMNTSIMIANVDLLFKNYFKKTVECSADEILGLTGSFEPQPHIQSYLISFPKPLLSNPVFIDWWNKMTIIRSKKLIISEYEVGLSAFLRELGFKLNPFFRCASNCLPHNPTHVHYPQLLDLFGVLKIELFKNNPLGANLAELNNRIKNNATLLQLVKEGLAN